MYDNLKPIQVGMRGAQRWTYAARQDLDPGIKALHANYAVAIIDGLRQMYSDSLIRKVTGEDAKALLNQATSLQDEAMKEIGHICPDFIPPN